MTSHTLGEKRKEEKYLVLKLDDIGKYLSPVAKDQLKHICARIGLGRTNDGKEDNHYVVVNEDEPYSEWVWSLVLGKPLPDPNLPTCYGNMPHQMTENGHCVICNTWFMPRRSK